MKKCVSEEFVKFCDEKYPGMKSNSGYRKMFMYLCFGTYIHGDTGKLAISYMTLAGFAGEKESAKNKNFSAIDFLKNFKNDVLPQFSWLDPDQIRDGYGETSWSTMDPCRSVNDDGLDAETKAMAAKEIGFAGPRYYFVDRKLFSRKNAAAVKKGALAAYENESKSFKLNPTQASIYNVLKDISLDGRIFTQRMNRNEDKINQAIDSIQLEFDDKISLEEKKAQQYKILDSIKEDPRIFYKPTPLSRTCRLHHSGECLLSFKSSVRKAFCTGWTEADLVNSQFVILAAILNAPLCKAFIASKQHLWSYLHNYATGSNDKPTKEIKSIYKQVIYGICFGSSRKRLKKILKTIDGTKLLKCPIIVELLQKRAEWFMNINSDGQVLDIWNNVHKLEQAGTVKDIYGNLVATDGRWAGSLAATRIQSIEMEIIEAAFAQNKKTAESFQWQITAFQHDGFTISYNNKDRKESVEKQIREAIKERAKIVGEKLGLDLSGVAIEFTELV